MKSAFSKVGQGNPPSALVRRSPSPAGSATKEMPKSQSLIDMPALSASPKAGMTPSYSFSGFYSDWGLIAKAQTLAETKCPSLDKERKIKEEFDGIITKLREQKDFTYNLDGLIALWQKNHNI